MRIGADSSVRGPRPRFHVYDAGPSIPPPPRSGLRLQEPPAAWWGAGAQCYSAPMSPSPSRTPVGAPGAPPLTVPGASQGPSLFPISPTVSADHRPVSLTSDPHCAAVLEASTPSPSPAGCAAPPRHPALRVAVPNVPESRGLAQPTAAACSRLRVRARGPFPAAGRRGLGQQHLLTPPLGIPAGAKRLGLPSCASKNRRCFGWCGPASPQRGDLATAHLSARAETVPCMGRSPPACVRTRTASAPAQLLSSSKPPRRRRSGESY